MTAERTDDRLEKRVRELEKALSGQRKINGELRESLSRLQSLYDRIPLGYQSLDEHGSFVDVNRAWLDLLGYSRDEVIGKSFADFLPSEWKDLFRENFPRFKAVGEVLGIEFEMIKKDGQTILVSFDGKIGKRSECGFLHTHCILHDITDRKLSEERTRSQAAALKAIFDSTPNILVIVNKEGRVERINHKGASFSGRREEQLIGLLGGEVFNCLNSFDGEGCGRNAVCVHCPVRSRMESTLATGIPCHEEEGRLTFLVDGRATTLDFLVSTALVELDGEKKTLLSITDITKLKQAEKEKEILKAKLFQARKMESIGNLAGGIAHDFNNILASILGYAELAMMGFVEKGSPLEDCLLEIQKAGKRARDLVRQILAFARRSNEERKPIRVDVIAKEVLKLIRSTIPTTIEIRQRIESESTVMGNAIPVNQVFMNLCTNAAQAMEDNGGVLEVAVRDVFIDPSFPKRDLKLEPGNYIEITISDTGVGIPEDLAGLIFEPYFTTKGPGEGTGMGLAMSQGIVESYGGKIVVESELGKGSVFSVYLPTTRKGNALCAEEDEDLPAGKERILFVDDELPIARMESRRLEMLGYRVEAKTSPREALELFREKPHEYDIVITDMTMPDMTGDRLAVELMRIRPDIPVVLCTGYSRKITDEKAAEIGIKAVVYKPVAMSEFSKTLRRLLDEAKNPARRSSRGI